MSGNISSISNQNQQVNQVRQDPKVQLLEQALQDVISATLGGGSGAQNANQMGGSIGSPAPQSSAGGAPLAANGGGAQGMLQSLEQALMSALQGGNSGAQGAGGQDANSHDGAISGAGLQGAGAVSPSPASGTSSPADGTGGLSQTGTQGGQDSMLQSLEQALMSVLQGGGAGAQSANQMGGSSGPQGVLQSLEQALMSALQGGNSGAQGAGGQDANGQGGAISGAGPQGAGAVSPSSGGAVSPSPASGTSSPADGTGGLSQTGTQGGQDSMLQSLEQALMSALQGGGSGAQGAGTGAQGAGGTMPNAVNEVATSGAQGASGGSKLETDTLSMQNAGSKLNNDEEQLGVAIKNNDSAGVKQAQGNVNNDLASYDSAAKSTISDIGSSGLNTMSAMHLQNSVQQAQDGVHEGAAEMNSDASGKMGQGDAKQVADSNYQQASSNMNNIAQQESGTRAA